MGNLAVRKAFLTFYLELYRALSWQPVWLNVRDPDEHHFHRRRFTGKYRAKQRIVRTLWLTVLVTVLVFPVLALAVFVGLFTTFLSFCILDETG